MTADGADLAPLLHVEGLSVFLRNQGDPPPLVQDVSFALYPGRTLAVVGESGCGKTLTTLALMALLDPSLRMHCDRLLYRGAPLSAPWSESIGALRGRKWASVFQESLTALNPLMRVGEQVAESLVHHLGYSWRRAGQRAVELLRETGLDDAAVVARRFAHELSGGMRQRVMIAMALACDPEVLFADEPTASLDATTQAQILGLLRRIQCDRHMALLFVTHDLALLPWIADDVAVMHAGQIVECRPLVDFLGGQQSHPQRHQLHPYSRRLFATVPRRAPDVSDG